MAGEGEEPPRPTLPVLRKGTVPLLGPYPLGVPSEGAERTIPDDSFLGSVGIFLGPLGCCFVTFPVLFGALLSVVVAETTRYFAMALGGVVLGALLTFGGEPLVLGLLRKVGFLPPPPSPKDRNALPPLEADATEGALAPPPQRGFPIRLPEGGVRERGEITRASAVIAGLMIPTVLVVLPAAFAPLGYLTAGLFAVGWGIGVLLDLGDKAFFDVDLLVPADPVPMDRRLPLQVRAVAARRIGIERVALSLWCCERVRRWKEDDRHEPELETISTWTKVAEEELVLDREILRGSELRVLMGLAFPAGMLPSAPPGSDPEPGEEGFAGRDWYVRLKIELARWPDAMYDFDLPRVVEGEGAPPVEPGLHLLDLGASGLAGEVVCPYCAAEIVPGDGAVACTRCDSLHHADCWNEAAECTIYACGGATARGVQVVRG